MVVMCDRTLGADKSMTNADSCTDCSQVLRAVCTHAWQREAYYLYYYTRLGGGLLDAARRRV
jgi:hypothetical protein